MNHLLDCSVVIQLFKTKCKPKIDRMGEGDYKELFLCSRLHANVSHFMSKPNYSQRENNMLIINVLSH